MLIKRTVSKIALGALILAVLAVPQISYADWGLGISIGDHNRDQRFYRYHDHPHFGLHIHVLPVGYFTVWAGGARYYYYDGLYYSYVGNGDYVLVNAPVGAYVNVIPSDFQPVIINGRTYYTDNGVYYILTEHHGYKVVVAPVVYAQPQQIVVAPPPVAAAPVVVDAQDTFPINVPNNNGGYVSVVIKKSGNGFVGPQGEFYTQFPSVTQLKVMYAK